ncbi:MAG: aldo/keto reductase [Candidatus Bathyarchaeota archaeon]|nr:MAG: aldo/keto reductase [Candidatus Bathyarchaeota archaeon]
MKYRNFGKLDWKVSALGFGVMRLPILDGDPAKIDEPEAIRMIRYAIDHGVNYLDTAYPYHRGKSENLLGKALKEGYRERVRLATKMPTWLIERREDFDKYLDEQLERLQVDRIDFYLLHGLGRARWPKIRDLGVTEWAEEKIAEGKFGHIGFSFHDECEILKEIIDFYDGWTLCQIQYNYMDTESSGRAPGTAGLKYAASKGLAVVIMEPIHGGRLAVTPPPEIQAIWDEAPIKRTPAEWALQWVWNHPEVSIVLSGMSTMEQVVENVESAGRSGPGALTPEELGLFERVQRKYAELGYIGCTDCLYCQPCPEGVAIPRIFAIINEGYTKAREETRERYQREIAPENRAGNCARCGTCEEQCPQQLPIMRLMRSTARFYEGSRS